MKARILTIILVLTMFIVAMFIFLSKRNAKALISVESKPEATVYINDKLVGTTPLEIEVVPGAAQLRLSTQENGEPLEYTTSLKPVSGVRTIIKRNLSKLSGSGVLFTLAPSSLGESISIVTIPSDAQVFLDNREFSTAPITIPNILVGKYVLSIRALGYQDYETPIQIVKGYEVQVFVDLQKTS